MAAFHFFFFFFLFSKSIHSFSISSFPADPYFALYGDAAVVDAGAALRLTTPANSTAGRIVYNKPIKLVRGKSRRFMSFSTDFSFSLSPNTGEDGLGFVILPSSFNFSAFSNGPFGFNFGSEKELKLNRIVVGFRTSSDAKNVDLIRTLVGVDVGYMRNSSLAGLGILSNSSWALIRSLNLHAWIDYEVGSRQLEVRLAEGNLSKKPSVPLLSFPIDFSQFWGEDEELLVGLSSSSHPCLVYSWRFEVKRIPKWMHSEPLDPKTIVVGKESGLGRGSVVKESNNCFMRVIAAMIFGTGCGALTAFVVLYLWTIFGNRMPVVPEEFAVQQMDLVKYKKVVVLDKPIEDDGKKVVDV